MISHFVLFFPSYNTDELFVANTHFCEGKHVQMNYLWSFIEHFKQL